MLLQEVSSLRAQCSTHDHGHAARVCRCQALNQACLMQVVPAEYAFVLHTAHPVTGERGRIFGEVVVGLGETLVGNYAGKALSFCSTPGTCSAALCCTVVSAHLPVRRHNLHVWGGGGGPGGSPGG